MPRLTQPGPIDNLYGLSLRNIEDQYWQTSVWPYEEYDVCAPEVPARLKDQFRGWSSGDNGNKSFRKQVMNICYMFKKGSRAADETAERPKEEQEQVETEKVYNFTMGNVENSIATLFDD